MSDALAAATKGTPTPKGKHPAESLGHEAVHAVSRFIQQVRRLPNADHEKIDEGVEEMRRGLDTVLAGMKNAGKKDA